MRPTRSVGLVVCLAAVPACLANFSSKDFLSQVPDCAVSCLISAVRNSSCAPTNHACICLDETFQFSAADCVHRSCPPKDSLITTNLTTTNCGAPIRDESTSHIIVTDVLGAVGLLFIIQRLLFKAWWKLGFGLDDGFILLTGLSTIPSLLINQFGAAANGLGRDIWTVPFIKITNFGMYFWTMAILYFSQMALLKMAILFFYLSVFSTKSTRIILWGTVIFNAAFGIGFVLLAILQCQPISYFWKKWDGEHSGHCIDANTIAWSNAAMNILLDFWMISIPLAQVTALETNWKKRVGIIMMFSVGVLATAVSILRLQFLIQFGRSTNITWDYLDVSRWSSIEVAVGEICACMPSVGIALARMFPGGCYTTRQESTDNEAERGIVMGTTSKCSIGPIKSNTDSMGDLMLSRKGSIKVTHEICYNVEYNGSKRSSKFLQLKDIDGKCRWSIGL